MTFYTPHVPQYCFSNNASPILHNLAPLPAGPTWVPSHSFDYSNTHIIALQNHVNQLQLELLQAKSAFSTLQAAFQELAHSVQLVNADPMNFSCASISPTTSSSIKQLPPINRMDFPNVLFWTRADWDKWQTTPQGLKQKGKCGLMALLEDKNGKSMNPLTVESHSDGSLNPEPMLLEGSPTITSNASLSLIVTPILPPLPKVEKENQPLTHACIFLTNPLMGLTCWPLVKSAVLTTTTVLNTSKAVPSLKLAPAPNVLNTSKAVRSSKLVPAPTVLNTSKAVPSSKLALLSPSKSTDPINTPFIPGIPVAVPQINDTAVPTTTASSKKPVKMWPGPTKKGCNLCALHWLKQVTPGSTNEFNAYYSKLNEMQVQSYDREAKELGAGQRTARLSMVLCISLPGLCARLSHSTSLAIAYRLPPNCLYLLVSLFAYPHRSHSYAAVEVACFSLSC
ncbi:hypothetical protein BDR07DRAFT_1490496 [Suillus spraguei]|nr:hypothetical protein BDR07DRAFT_1490496 [Suillus spraguei]